MQPDNQSENRKFFSCENDTSNTNFVGKEDESYSHGYHKQKKGLLITKSHMLEYREKAIKIKCI